MNKTAKLKSSKIIAAAEIVDPKRIEALKAYMETKVKALALGASTFEIDPESMKVEWKDLLEEIDKIIDLRSDCVWVWRFDAAKNELLRTKISSQP
jgi:hypothetical protein